MLPEGVSQESDERFYFELSTLDGLTEEPAKQEIAYLVDMARVEALETRGEKERAVELLDRHV